MSAAEPEFDVEAFATALREQMEQNARMIDALEDICQSPSEHRAAAGGLQRSIREENRRLKDFARVLPFDIPEEQRASNWDDITTMRD